MRTPHILIAAILTAILGLPAIGQMELPPGEDDLMLIGRPDPTLAGIANVLVVFTPDHEPNQAGLNWQELHTKVVARLSEAGLKPLAGIAGNILEVPELRISAEITDLPDLNRCVIRVETSFARKMALPDQDRIYIKAEVWKTEPHTQVVSSQDLPDTLAMLVFGQVDAFIHAYMAANPPGKQGADANTTVNPLPTVRGKRAAAPAKTPDAESQFTASRNSEVFHKPGCPSAVRISAENRVTYKSRNDAIAAGKRPCKRCNP